MRRLGLVGLAVVVGACSKPAPTPAPPPPPPVVDSGPALGTYFVGEDEADVSEQPEGPPDGGRDAGARPHLRFGSEVHVELPLSVEFAHVHFDGGLGYVPARALTQARPELEPILVAARAALEAGDLARAAERAVVAERLAPGQLETEELLLALVSWVTLPHGDWATERYDGKVTVYAKPEPGRVPSDAYEAGDHCYVAETMSLLSASAADNAPPIAVLPAGAQVTVLKKTKDTLFVRAELPSPGELLPLEPIADAGADAGAPVDAGATDAGATDAGVADAGAPAEAGPTPSALEGYLPISTPLRHAPHDPAELWQSALAYAKAGQPGPAWTYAELSYALAPDAAHLPDLVRIAVAARHYNEAGRAAAAWKGLVTLEKEVVISNYLGCRGDPRTADIVSDAQVSHADKLPKNACLANIDYPACNRCGSSAKAEERRTKQIDQHREKREKQFPGGPWLSVSLLGSYRPEHARETLWLYALPIRGQATCGDNLFFPGPDGLRISQRPVVAPVGVGGDFFVRAPSFDELLVGLVQAPDRAGAFEAVRKVATNLNGYFPYANDCGPKPNQASEFDLCEVCECGD